MTNQEVIDKIKKIKKPIYIPNGLDEMNYTIHKFFDLLINHKDINNKVIVKVEKDDRIFPFYINLEDYFKDNNKIWSQEYKIHFDITLSQSSTAYFISFKADRVTKPKKVFVKEFDGFQLMKEVSEMKKAMRES